jgi:hypothetical protein
MCSDDAPVTGRMGKKVSVISRPKPQSVTSLPLPGQSQSTSNWSTDALCPSAPSLSPALGAVSHDVHVHHSIAALSADPISLNTHSHSHGHTVVSTHRPVALPQNATDAYRRYPAAFATATPAVAADMRAGRLEIQSSHTQRPVNPSIPTSPGSSPAVQSAKAVGRGSPASNPQTASPPADGTAITLHFISVFSLYVATRMHLDYARMCLCKNNYMNASSESRKFLLFFFFFFSRQVLSDFPLPILVVVLLTHSHRLILALLLLHRLLELEVVAKIHVFDQIAHTVPQPPPIHLLPLSLIPVH